MERPGLQNALGLFNPVGLSEMDGIKLMNRVETKYVFSAERLPVLLSQLVSSYKILEMENVRSFPYYTVYFDSSDFMFFNQQVTGRFNRHKVRFRTYVSTGATYLEIKRKTNRKRTVKWRIENSFVNDSFNDDALKFIEKYIPGSSSKLLPVLINRFTRVTIAGIETKERITIDYNISFSKPDGSFIELPCLAIAEVKREGEAGLTPFMTMLKMNSIRPMGFSKYCLGNALLRDMPRKNVLKSKLLLINKIENEYLKPVVA